MFRIRCFLKQELRCLILKTIDRKFSSSVYVNSPSKEIIKKKQVKYEDICRKEILYLPHNPKVMENVVKKSFFKRADKGLYANRCIQFGNNVPKSKLKTRRKWLPNIQKKLIYSKALDKLVQLKVSTRALRTIAKVGGLDEYLTGNKSARLKELGMRGWELREMILKARKNKEETFVDDSKDEKSS
ncbi:ribosomal protein L28 [Pneumocystis carinii B80]|uniref:Large ribosomal subunit protein bL28m n=1 Tax=Pneumocystis carinii (strain B80) TaxID=1408658 RepID=A0A0W4ZJH7_PNEC8|nr:ribosomal protein L28 [Pneumocystis carinii B80]KTW28516.1 ribosomal protein L28 [Pneumocystis carinii B80]